MHVKEVLILKCFKLSSEAFQKKLLSHQRRVGRMRFERTKCYGFWVPKNINAHGSTETSCQFRYAQSVQNDLIDEWGNVLSPSFIRPFKWIHNSATNELKIKDDKWNKKEEKIRKCSKRKRGFRKSFRVEQPKSSEKKIRTVRMFSKGDLSLAPMSAYQKTTWDLSV